MEIQPIQMPLSLTRGAIEPIQPIVADAYPKAAALSPANFQDLLKNAIADLNVSQIGSNEKIRALATGGEENLHDIMIAMEKANLTLQYAIQIRNKVLEAYQSIIQMQV